MCCAKVKTKWKKQMKVNRDPIAWRWVFDGNKPDSDKCFQMPGPSEDAIARAALFEPPRTIQYLFASSSLSTNLSVEDIWNNDELMAVNARLGLNMSDLCDLIRCVERTHGIGNQW